ncbi:MAG: DUF58 domain-containing protein [Gammaproteobacteria bacterium]|nr:DUF58 domain-containing protein [Gammaproteobacteria bacterium]MDH3447383.1 DUF58 domain-containing protein [Gammaproteobacteria bacterium]
MLSASLPRSLRRRIDHWFESHNPPSGDCILLHNRRLYILPTRFGYLFAMMLLFLFLAAINYQNSMAFVLTFMLTSLGIISLWYTHKNLLGVSVRMQIPRPVFCGEVCEFKFEVSHTNNSRRYAIGIQYLDQSPVYLKLGPEGSCTVKLKLPARRRGEFRPAGITVFTRYPTGLFHAWGWLRFDLPILVYPRPATNVKLQQTMVEQYDGQTSTSTIEGDDFAGLREHREGESLRHISWKAYAQGRGLLTKTFQGQARPSLWIDWDLLAEASLEDKLSFMTALVLAAESEEQKYGLKLPGIIIEQGYGNAHKHNCLQALAVFRQPDLNQEFGGERG